MESLQKIQTRLKSVRNISQITKAMEVVAATKMRRSQEIALASRAYTFGALDVLGALARLDEVPLPPLLVERPIERRAFVVVTSDKGLAGAFNGSVLRAFTRFVAEHGVDLRDERNVFVAVGQKAAAFLERSTHGLAAAYVRVGDYTTPAEVASLSTFLIDGYLEGRWDEVLVFSTHFKSALSQKVIVGRVLPVTYEHLVSLAREIVPEHGRFADVEVGAAAAGAAQHVEYLIEPSPEEVLDALSRHLVSMELYHTILEANASEHAARRTAMKSASDNADELSDTLTVAYNKSRQASVTNQIIEIAAGAESLQR